MGSDTTKCAVVSMHLFVLDRIGSNLKSRAKTLKGGGIQAVCREKATCRLRWRKSIGTDHETGSIARCLYVRR